MFVVFNPRNARKLEFSDYLWLPFLGQPESDVVVLQWFILIYIKSFNTMETSKNDIITFNETLESLSTAIPEIINIDES